VKVCRGFSSDKTQKQSKLVQLDKMLYKWFTAMHSEGKPITLPAITKTVRSYYDEMKITDKCTFSEGTNKEPSVRRYVSTNTV
jgi:hypothetical protein